MVFKESKAENEATILQIRIKKSEKEKLKEVAKILDMTVTDLIKESVDEYINRHDYLL